MSEITVLQQQSRQVVVTQSPAPSVEVTVPPDEDSPVVEVTHLAGPMVEIAAPGPQGKPGPAGPPGAPGSAPQAYTHSQGAPGADWDIQHNLGYHPGGISVIDSSGSEVEGEVEYLSVDHLVLHFSAPFSGIAYLS